MTEPRTIDNLGVETSVRWATDQKLLDKTLLQDASTITKQTLVDVYTPFYTSEFDLIFETKQRYKQWAAFFAPPGYMSQKMRLFMYQVIPSLGTDEFQEAQMQKIQDHREANKKKRKKTPSGTYAWEDEREEEEEERESKMLLSMLEMLRDLDQLIGMINARRSQYSKG